jgi:hypothetical protein
MIPTLKRQSGLKIIFQGWVSGGSLNRAIFSLPDGSTADFYITFTHSEYGSHVSSWEPTPMGKISEKPAHFDEAMGLLSGESEPDLGAVKFQDMLDPYMHDDWGVWMHETETRSREEASFEAASREAERLKLMKAGGHV